MSRRAPVAALAAIFGLLGVIDSSWVSRLPAITANLRLSDAQLGIALLGAPVGAIAASLALPQLMRRFGTERVLFAVLPVAAGLLVLPGLATGVGSLAGALLVLGVATGGVDVAMNAYGIRLQDSVGRSVFGRLHAMWSLGGFLGSGGGALAASQGASPAAHLGAVAVAVAVLSLVPLGVLARRSAAWTVPATDPTGERGHGWSLDRRVVTLAAIGVAAFVVEVSAADWGGVFLRQDLHAGATLAAGAFAGFALPHAAIRMFGDPVVDRMQPRSLLTAALLMTAVSGGLLAAAPAPLVAFGALALLGVGVGLVIPVSYAVVGRVPGMASGRAVATAAGWGYVGWAAAPPAIGGLSAGVGLRAALALPAIAALVAFVLAWVGGRSWDNWT